MSTKTPKTILFGTPIGAVAGAVAGYFLPQQMLELSFLGQIFVNVLWIVAVPLILAVVAVGIGSLGDGKRIRQMVGPGLLYIVGTTAIAILIGVAVAGVMTPGAGIESEGANPPQQAMQAQQVTLNGLMGTLVPRSLVQAAASGEYFVIIIAALLFGTVLATMGHRRRLVLDVLRSVSEVLQKLVRWIMWAAPIGVFFLTATLFANQPEMVAGITGNMGMFLLALLIGLALHSLVVLPLLLRYFGNRPPLEYLGRLVPALASAFGSGSSTATLPITHQCVVGDSRVDNRAAALMLPLGATINIGGTIMFVVMGAMFVSQLMPDQVSALQILTISAGALVMSLVMASATNIPGIPGAGLLTLAILFRVAGMPDEAFGALGLLAGVEWLVHRICASVNVWSDAVGASVIAARVNAQSSRDTAPDRSSRRTPDRTRPAARSDSRRDRRDERRPGGRGGGRPDRRQKPTPERREAPPSPPVDLHRAKDSSSPFALKQDNVVDLDATPVKKPTGDDSPKGNDIRTSRPSSDSGRPRSGGRPDRPPRGRSSRPDGPRNGGHRGPDREDRRAQERPPREHREENRPERPTREHREENRPERPPREHREENRPERPTRERREGYRQDRPRPESRPTRERAEDKREVDFDQQAIDREKARVAAQLADMKRTEQTQQAVPTASAVATASVEPKQSAAAPVIDYSSPDMANTRVSEKPAVAAPDERPARSESRPKTTPPKAEPTPEVVPVAKSEAAEEEPAVSFGRSHRTRGSKPSDRTKKSTPDSDRKTADSDSDVEVVTPEATSFGRAKKKRTRR